MSNQKRLMFVFGTRPEAIKMAPVISAVKKYADMLTPVVVTTGQHRQMLDQVLRVFKLKPDYDLEIMEDNQTPADVLTKTLRGLEEIILREKPDMVLVQGDTATTFAAGLAAYYARISLGHIEAGLRTFDKWRPYPEEINRKLTTALADLYFAPTETSRNNLLAENISPQHIYLTGNTVIDALLEVAAREFDLKEAGIVLSEKKRSVLVTAHRRESFGQPLINICRAVLRLAQDYRLETEFIIPVHKNPKVSKTIYQLLAGVDNIKLLEPLDYEPFIHLMKKSYLVLTDSGGIQEEAPSLGKPVLVLREKTERPEAIAAGTVKLVGFDEEAVFNEVKSLLANKKLYDKMSRAVNPYGDGQAAGRIVQAILYYFGRVDRKPAEFIIRG